MYIHALTCTINYLLVVCISDITSTVIIFYRFIDSHQHLSTSLDKLVKNLTVHGTDRLHYLKAFINEQYGGSMNKLNLLRRKGVYPYSYVDSMDRFDEGKPLHIYQYALFTF